MFAATTLEPRASAVDACAQALRAAILDGRLAPGERLPPERTLAAQFGLNRLTLRAALSQLSAAGLLTVRQGSGYIVQDFRRAGGPDLLPGLLRLAAQSGTLRELATDLLTMRRQLARAVLERLAASLDARGTKRLHAAVAGFARVAVAGADPAAVAAADLVLTGQILDETGSAVLRLLLNPITGVLAELPALRDAMYVDPPANAAGYQVLLAWLATDRTRGLDVVIAELERRDRATVSRLRPGRTRK